MLLHGVIYLLTTNNHKMGCRHHILSVCIYSVININIGNFPIFYFFVDIIVFLLFGYK